MSHSTAPVDNIVDRRRADAAEERLRLLVDSVRDYAIFVLDPTGHVQTWNPGAERIKGYTAHEIIGQHFSKFYPASQAHVCDRELEVAAREGRFEDEGWRVRKDGTQFWANVVISAIRDHDDRLVGFSKVTRDLTDRKRAEEERAARLAAEQANRAKDEFLAMLGHELRNPLAPIVTALQLMRLRDPRGTKEQDIIERQVKHLMLLVDDLLDVSRIARGKVELKRTELDLRDPLAKAIEVASPLLEQRRHHLDISVPAHRLMAIGDEARLTQVFSNLITNAAKYTDFGGHIVVRARRDRGDNVIEVIDDGIGIPAELLPRVFDLFVQGAQSSERSVGGLGLGLTLVRSLVTVHGGNVEARSEGPGRGSTFTVRLPVAALVVAPEQPRAVTPLERTDKAHRILVVDDNEDARMLLAEILTAVGHDVRSAGDGLSALELVRSFAPQIAILDIGLPVMDGYELASRIHGELQAAAPRLIALTGYGQPHDQERSQAAHFDAHLVKPVDIGQLLARITQLEV